MDDLPPPAPRVRKRPARLNYDIMGGREEEGRKEEGRKEGRRKRKKAKKTKSTNNSKTVNFASNDDGQSLRIMTKVDIRSYLLHADRTDEDIKDMLDHFEKDFNLKQINLVVEIASDLNTHADEPADRKKWNNVYGMAVEARTRVQVQGSTANGVLGGMIQSLGFGSSAGSHRDAIDKVLTSLNSAETNRAKGHLISHSFYRSFLQHIKDSTLSDEEESALKSFEESYMLIWKKTDYGIVRKKNANDVTPETNATSLLGPIVNNLIRDLNPTLPKEVVGWATEYELVHKVTDEKEKRPRTDGFLVVKDPLNKNVFRPLVSMEAKHQDLDEKARYQSRSNAIDALAQKPKNKTPWPLLSLRLAFAASCNCISVHALVPSTEKSVNSVILWEYSGQTSKGMFFVIRAAVKAAIDFTQELEETKKDVGFCSVARNIAANAVEKKIYKAFINTRRKDNYELVKEFVDNDAERTPLGNGNCYLTMRYLGSILTNKHDCKAQRFVDVAKELQKLHKLGKCHGDVRLSNLILGGEEGKLIDFDLAGEAGVDKYPDTLLDLVDGSRHPDVSLAMERKEISDLCLQKVHDWYSLHAILGMFEPKDEVEESNDFEWNEFVLAVEGWKDIVGGVRQKVEGGDRQDTEEEFNFNLDFDVAIKSDQEFLFKENDGGTGSPIAE